MFWNKKKEEPKEVPVDPDVSFIKETLNDLNLLDINNLVDLAEIVANKKDKEEFTRIMKLLEPEIIKAVREGKTHGEVFCDKVDVGSFPRNLFSKTADLTGLYISINGNWIRNKETNEDIFSNSRYIFDLNRPNKDN